MTGPASIIGVNAIRIARLAANGTPDFNNATGGFMLCGGVSTFAHEFDIQDGADMYVEDAAGNPCVIRKKPDKLKRVTFTLTLCRDDYRLSEILCSPQVATIPDGAVIAGRAFKTAQGCGSIVAYNGVSIELWSEQWDCNDALAAKPYMRTVLARAYVVPSGFTRENGVSMPVYKGFSVPNANYGDGPFGDLDLISAITGWAMIDIDNDVVPSCPSPIGYINIPPSAS